MHIEYEGRVLEINHDEVIKKLESLGAIKNSETFQKRYVYDFKPQITGKWIRLRTNGLKHTLTIKNIEKKAIDGVKELEIEVSNFEDTNLILEQLGYTHRTFQENKRIQYTLNGVEISLDTWPMIPEYLEIEGKNEEEVYNTLKKLEISKDKLITLDVESIYQHYGYDITNLNNLSFDMEGKNEKF